MLVHECCILQCILNAHDQSPHLESSTNSRQLFRFFWGVCALVLVLEYSILLIRRAPGVKQILSQQLYGCHGRLFKIVELLLFELLQISLPQTCHRP